jgi:hypothetical protein
MENERATGKRDHFERKDVNLVRLRAEIDRLRNAPAPTAQQVAKSESEKPTEQRGPSQITETEVSAFLGGSAGEQGSIVGAVRTATLSRQIGSPEEFARNRELAQQVRGELE